MSRQFDSFLFDVEVSQIIDPASAAQTAVNNNSAPIDVGDCEAFAIMVAVGTIASSGTVDCKLKQGDASDGSDLADVEGSALTQMTNANTDSNKCWITEVIRSRNKFVSVNITRAGGNSDIRGVWIFKYGKRVRPVTQGTKIHASEQLASPANGTA